MKENILILGGGPAGLACAYELANKNIPLAIIEKDDALGGLCKTLTFKENNLIFRTDIGPHRFFSKNKSLYELIEKLLGKDWILVKRKTRQMIEGKFYDYPINAVQAFNNIGYRRAFFMFLSYLSGNFKYRVLKKEIVSFEDYIVANFGKELGNFNMLNYTEKIWGMPCNKIHPDWAKQRIKGLSLMSALFNSISLKKNKDSPKTLIEAFYYPKYGTGQIYSKMEEKIISKKNKIFVNSIPIKIIHKNNKIIKVSCKINGKIINIEPKKLVSSIPLTDFINLLYPKPPIEVLNAVNNLKWRAQVYLFITLNKERITDDNWIYFPNKEIPFGRVSEMKNFSKEMSPPDKTSLFVEFFVNENDQIWKMPKQELFDLTVKHFENLGLFKKKDVRKYYIIKRTKVYPVYDLNYIQNLKIIKNYLDKFSNLYYIGRPGRFQYTNQDHSLEMGLLAAKSIIDNKRYDFDKIGSEKDYFEKGELRQAKNN